MSEAIQEEAQTAPEGIPATDGLQTEEAEQQVVDFDQRVMSDGQFAIEQIRKRDGHATQLSNRLQKLESVEKVVNAAGGADELLGLANLGSQIQQNPALAELVRSALETGQIPVQPQEEEGLGGGLIEDDEFADPFARKLGEATSQEIGALKAQISELKSMVNQTSVAAQEVRVREAIENHLKQFEHVPEAYEAARKKIGEAYQASFARAQQGSESEADLIRRLAGPGADDILEAVTTKVTKQFGSKLFAERPTHDPNAIETLSLSTDERAETPARTGEEPLPSAPNGMVSPNYVLAVLERNAREAGVKLPS